MSDGIIGPNRCHYCGGEYGEHDTDCMNNPKAMITPQQKAERLARECAKSFYCYGARLPLSDHIVISLPLTELITVAEAAERIEQDAKFTLLEMGDNGKEMLMSLHKSLVALHAKLPKE